MEFKHIAVVGIFACVAIHPRDACSAAGVYEGFDSYAAVSEVTSGAVNGGAGFSDHWQGRSTLLGSGSGYLPSALTLLPESLSYSDSQGAVLATSGGALHLSGEFGNSHLARPLDVGALPNSGVDPQLGKTTYVSFLARRTGPAANPDDPVYGGSYPWGANLYPRAAGFNFFSSDNGDAVQLLVGNPSNEDTDVWRLRGQDLDGTSKDPSIDEPFGAGALTYLVVIRIDHGEGDGQSDEINMYLNPDLADESLNTVGVTADWETRDDPLYLPGRWIGLEVGNASSNRPYSELTFDEFRIGQTWGDVAPISPVSELPGDYNRDGAVDAADYTVWRDQLGGADESAIGFNGDGGGVEPSDYALWRYRFGDAASPLNAVAPEPSAAAVFLLATLGGWAVDRRRAI